MSGRAVPVRDPIRPDAGLAVVCWWTARPASGRIGNLCFMIQTEGNPESSTWFGTKGDLKKIWPSHGFVGTRIPTTPWVWEGHGLVGILIII